MLDHVQADDRPDHTFVGKRYKVGACDVRDTKIDVGKPLARFLDRSGINIDTDIVAVAVQNAGIAAVSDADFKHWSGQVPRERGRIHEI